MLTYINGVNHITRIASDSDVEIGLVKACVQNLVYYQVVDVLPLFKYSNVYMCTRNLTKLSTDKELTQACRYEKNAYSSGTSCANSGVYYTIQVLINSSNG